MKHVPSSEQQLAARLVAELQPLLTRPPVASNPIGVVQAGMVLERAFGRLGFNVKRHRGSGVADVLIAERGGESEFCIGLSAHYDIEEAGQGWVTEPFSVVERGGRLHARGIADNLGPLLLRLMALETVSVSPRLLFVVQGEEEIGSSWAHTLYPSLQLPRVDLWLEETGYYEEDGTQRLLARRTERLPRNLREALEASARSWGRSLAAEDRYMNKAFGTQKCPFLTHLVGDAPYLAIGPNDSRSFIHRPNESLAIANLAPSVHQFHELLKAAAKGAT